MKRLLAALALALLPAFASAQMVGGIMESQAHNASAITGGVLAPQFGGTGIANTSTKTITLGGPFVTSGAFTTTLTMTGTTTVTFPVTGTLATLAGAEAFTNKTYNGNTWTAGTGTLTIAAGKTLTQNNNIIHAGTDGTTMTYPAVSGTVCASGNQCTATSFAPSTTSGIIGSATNDAAAAGSVGEYKVVTWNAVTAAASVTYQDTATLALTAGDWICGGQNVPQYPQSTTTVLIFGLSVGTTGNTFSDDVFGDNDVEVDLSTATVANVRTPMTIAGRRFSLSGSTNLLVKTRFTYSGTAPTSTGRASCVRVR